MSRDFAYQERKLLRWIFRGPQGSDEASNALMEFEYVAQRREREDEVLLTCSLILEVRDFLQHPKWEVRRTDQASAVRDRVKRVGEQTTGGPRLTSRPTALDGLLHEATFA